MLMQSVRRVLLLLLTLVLCVDAGQLRAGVKKPPPQQEVLEQLIAEAQANNPETKASEERWRTVSVPRPPSPRWPIRPWMGMPFRAFRRGLADTGF